MRAAVLPYGCRTIGNRAFEGCAGLSFVRISDSVTAIGDGAFRNCPHLETVTLPRSLTRIGPGAFDDAVTARVYRDSFAHQWCIDNGIPFELIAGGDSGSAPSAEELEQAREDMPEDILDVQSRFEDGDGYVSGANRAAAIAAVAEYLDGEKAAGHIDEFDIDGRQILYVDAASREVWAWAPPMRGLMAGGDGITSSVVTLQAFDFGKAQWGQSITDKLDNFVGEPIYEDLTPEYVETKLGPNQVVIFMTHGLAYGNFNVLTTARTYDSAFKRKYNMELSTDASLSDLRSNATKGPELIHSIVSGINGDKDSDRVMITPFFVKNRCKRLDNSFIYLGACFSAKPDKLGRSFLNRGAVAVVGFDKPVVTQYDHDILEMLIDKMCKTKYLGQYRTIRRHVWRCLFCRASHADFLIYLQ